MSRCFPFLPPAYEKKARVDEVNLLKKEKQKGKKHKKDKRESKEKKEKEGRDGKNKEKKDKRDKKEKHREKKKDKDKSRGRDKSKIGTADDKGFPVQAEGPNAGKLHQKEIKQSDKGILFENKPAKQYTSNNGEKARENNHLAEENKDRKFLLELDRRIRDVNGGAGNQLVQKFTNTDCRKDEGTVRVVAKGCGTWPDRNEKLMDKGLHGKKINGRGMWAEVPPLGNATVQNHAGKFHPSIDGMPKLLGKYFNKNLEATIEGEEKAKGKTEEGKEMAKEKKDEGEGQVKEKKGERKEKKEDKRGDKRKDKEKEKKGHGKDKDGDKEKKENKAKEQHELEPTEHNKLYGSDIIGPIDSNSFTQVSRNNHEIAINGKIIKKRKDIESNGVPYADDMRPSKFPRLFSSLPLTENGRVLEPCQISITNASDTSGVATSVKIENEECKINGIIEAQPSAFSSNKTHSATVPADPITETSAKPPHPDNKYLSQVYSVPKVEQWSVLDDQEWLFGRSVSQDRKLAESSEHGETLQVWAEALHIEPADVFALPYVIPY
ncbi:glutamic acid-rich protein-like [Abrus precatorius]|uniref:Glutamic acid-rich protein-like n=1 Tax=Abrus precatorius TaxID=3816 RepID=A0A8B8KWR2_ABRPR|nr:glutamic acid-rich protein-like [Abrus precatorius]XP_027346919.1 glutamic acid-rich protein-like [Abrus precatorius]